MNLPRIVLALLVINFAPVQAEENDLLGDEGILFWSPEQQITGYRSISEIYPTREINAGARPYPLIPTNTH